MSIKTAPRPAFERTYSILLGLFFLSGLAALSYQVTWQRLLFTAFGVDIESVTIVVSVFMFGLGAGALAGGAVADRFAGHLLRLFAMVEMAIGAFGLLSPALIEILNDALAGSSRAVAAVGSFAVLAVPTILMGATLPVLVTHVNRTNANIGEAVGRLYFANTAGAAAGAFLTGYWFLLVTDLHGVIRIAATINIAVAICALLAFRQKP
ncbi:MAG TPA: fused MFS/spermidine synthase [Burkholderiales bacterium]|nr:fused MFS/spermidine synthase [Burkholderiales bacterium]